ncbi:galactokinase [Bacillus sp. JCM 19034]|uniref:galactokinase n=1 Tax=Bacillus sp. JCM 19034 TaxID=1481928 RepID=UPI0007813E65|nr:galactokinase [Bacillus sp. JCM 19034]
MDNQLVKDCFMKEFSANSLEQVRTFFAPGRVNLIGEHTDYNGGFVFPTALTIGTYMAIRPREDELCTLTSTNFDQKVSFSLDDVTYKDEDDWGNYPKGIINELLKVTDSLKGIDVVYHGTIPNGAGLSSSASIGMVTAFGLSELFDVSLSRVELAKLCQRMENHFIGVNSGIMDQYAVGLCKEKHAIYLNTNTMEAHDVPLELGPHKIVITNTNKRRGLADSKYNERRAECEEALAIIKQYRPEWNTLSDAKVDDLAFIEATLDDDVLYRRVKHIVTENARTEDAKLALESGDLKRFGKRMLESHISLRDDYEVTGEALDALFDAQRVIDGCIGTRMTGAGFGGCSVSIVVEDQVAAFKEQVEKTYKALTGLEPSFYICEAGNGVSEI